MLTEYVLRPYTQEEIKEIQAIMSGKNEPDTHKDNGTQVTEANFPGWLERQERLKCDPMPFLAWPK